MAHRLTSGIKGKASLKVTPKDTAEAYGSGKVAVFATPALIGLMENAAHLSVQAFLEEGFITVGTEVNIRHLKATPVGMTVTTESELMEVEGNKLKFSLSAFDENGQIGFGTHTRYVVHAESFLKKV
ncbi:MAG: thioesterase family protein [Bacteroidales bacterium]|jgi:predicted thioesterase|nr:thioesterase family protein [Bacteroidales bacterium]NLM91718.1 thioesterase family protein [Bacteroidales bacterium]